MADAKLQNKKNYLAKKTPNDIKSSNMSETKAFQ
jgi:hypothetical protein